MSTSTLNPAEIGITFGRLHKAELHKLYTSRTVYLLGTAIISLTILFAWLVAALNYSPEMEDYSSGEQMRFILQALTATLYLTIPLFGLLAALCIATEFSSKSISSALSATPKRTLYLLAKTCAITAINTLIGSVSWVAASILIVAFYKVKGLAPSINQTYYETLGYTALSIALFCLLGVAIGTLIRNPLGAFFLNGFLLFALPLGLILAPSMFNINSELVLNFSKVLPTNLALGLGGISYGLPEPGMNLLVLSAWTIIPFVFAVYNFNARDIT